MIFNKVRILGWMRRLDLLRYFNFGFRQGSIQIPVGNGEGLELVQDRESWMDKLLLNVVSKKKGSFVDVGANIGQTLLKLKKILPDFNYVGFEPNPHCIKYINEFIEVNRWVDCMVHPFGLALENKSRDIYLYNYVTDPGGSMVENFRPSNKVNHVLQVETKNASEVNSLLNDVCCVKIDVEGMEYEALKCLENTIAENRPVLIFEILPVYSQDFPKRLANQNQMVELLTFLNYKIYRVFEKDVNLELELLPLNTIEIHGNIEWINYVAVPKEEVETLIESNAELKLINL